MSKLRSVENVLKIIYALRETSQEELGLNELSRFTGINKGTVYKILPSLLERNLITQNPNTRKYRLGVGLIHLSEKVYSDLNIYEISRPYITDLAKDTGKTVTLGIKQKDKLFFIESINGNESANFYNKVGVGESIPFYIGAAAKACFAFEEKKILQEYIEKSHDEQKDDINRFLNEIDTIRSNNYSVSDEEVDKGVYALGAPLFNYEGVIGGIAIAGIKQTFSSEDIKKISQLIINCSKSISEKLGHKN